MYLNRTFWLRFFAEPFAEWKLWPDWGFSFCTQTEL